MGSVGPAASMKRGVMGGGPSARTSIAEDHGNSSSACDCGLSPARVLQAARDRRVATARSRAGGASRSEERQVMACGSGGSRLLACTATSHKRPRVSVYVVAHGAPQLRGS